MTFEIVVTEPAESDADTIFRWLEDQSERGAQAWSAALLKCLRSLESQASIYPLAPEAEKLGEPIRQVAFRTPHGRPYRIVYTIRESTVFVLRVRGGTQNWLGPADIQWSE